MLHIFLFGGFHLEYAGDALPPIPGQKPRALFSYLITYRHRAHSRDLLAGTFWPDLPNAKARRRLSHALWQIRHLLEPLPGPVPYLLTEAGTIQVNPKASYWLDVAEFEELVDWETEQLVDRSEDQPTELPGHQVTDLPMYHSTHLPALRQAVELYTGDFLAGFYDDWVVIERERLREMFLAALSRLVASSKREGHYDEALRYAQRLAAADPLREEGHREVMRLCYLLGRDRDALQQYDLYRAVLAEELGVEPTATTTALYRKIVARAREAKMPYLPPASGRLPSPLLEGSGQVPLVGREQERTILVSSLEQTINGRGGLLLLEGEAGVGKTRLLQEVARDAEWRGVRVLWGRGREMAKPLPYGLLIEVLRSGLSPLRAKQLAQVVDGIWLRVASLLLPELAEWLPDLPPHVTLEPGQERERLLEALTRTILALGQIAPHLLILEGLQWADEATLEGLMYLARRLRNFSITRAESHVMLIGSCRGEEARERTVVWEALQALDRAGCRRLELAPLTAEETGELVRQGLGLKREVPRFEERLYRETKGNPLFVLETLRALCDEGLLYRSASGEWSTPWDETTTDYAELPLSPEVYEVITQRLARLGPDERALLNTAAVLGADFDLALLLQSTYLEQEWALAAASELVRRQILVEMPTVYRFSHDKVRQVTYMEIAEAERRRLHRRAGEALRLLHPEQVEALAHHFTEAQVWDAALAYNRQAGDRARAVYANQAALTYYEQALSLVDDEDLEIQWEIQRQREEALDTLGRREEQATCLAEMMRLTMALSDEGRRAATLYRQGRLKVRTGAPSQGLALLRKGAELAREQGNLRLAGKCYATMGRAYWHQSDASRCLTAVEEAHTLFRQANDRSGELEILNLKGNLYLGLLGHYEQALHSFEQMATMARELNDRETEHAARGNAGIALMALGRYRQSQAYLAQAETFFAQGHKLWQAVIAFGQGNDYLGLGDYEAARSAAEQSLAICQEIGNYNFAIESHSLLGMIDLYQGRYSQARTHFAEAIEVGLAGEQPHDVALQQSYLALTYLHLGEGEKALRLSAESVSLLERLNQNASSLWIVHFQRYQILSRLEGIEAALPHLEQAYGILMAGADAIHDPELRSSFLENVRENQQIIAAYKAWQAGVRPTHVRLARADAPTGRPLGDDEWVEITWTLVAPEDEAISGKVARRQHRLLRLLREAEEQGAAPTVDDLASALKVGRATIKRDLAAMRETGQTVRTRGSRNTKYEIREA